MSKVLFIMKTCSVAICLSWLLASCEYNNEEELYPMGPCDTTDVSYHGTIAPLIMQHCFECHGGSAQLSGIPLEGHANLITMVQAGRLVGAVRHMQGFSAMPKDRQKLAECDILKIEKWVDDGAPDN